MKIEYYENESKKNSGCNYQCACINTDDFSGVTDISQIESRCATKENAKAEVLKQAILLRDALNELIESSL